MTSREAHAYDVWARGMVLTLHRDRTLIPAIVAPFMSLAVRRIEQCHLQIDPAALGYAMQWLKVQGWDEQKPRKRTRSGREK